MSRPKHAPEQNPLLLLGAFVVIGAVLFGVFQFTGSRTGQPTKGETAGSTPTPNPAAPESEEPPAAIGTQPFQHGHVIRKKFRPRKPGDPEGPVFVEASTGRSGTGTRLAELPALDLPAGPPVEGAVTTAVANIPRRSGLGGFSRSLRTLTSAEPDFVVLNEVGSHTITTIRRSAPGYGAYRDPVRDSGRGGRQSMHNVVLWNIDRWTLIDAGRVKLVDNDVGFHRKKPFVWDRYATWTTLQRVDGAILSVVGTHMMTNPGRFPRQHGNPRLSRAQQYGYGMDVLRGLSARLAVHGPVLVGGDMNAHPGQGAWAPVSKMRSAGYRYTRDRGVMYLFYPRATRLLDSRQVRIASDHPALYTRVDMNGLGPG